MEFKFKVQQYQTLAATAVADVFDGQPKIEGQQFVRDLGSYREAGGTVSLDLVYSDSDGYKNAQLAMGADNLLANIWKVQDRNGIERSRKLSHTLGACELDVEMETGTGKTYVYTETIFELNKRYGWSKFIIVVPNVAIREGVGKSLAITQRHFSDRYGKRIWWFIYNSDRLNELDTFASRDDISVMIINMQNFNRSFKEGGTSKEALRMYSERDDFGSRRPIDVLAATNPILILDEPQKMGKKNSATRKAMQQFHPLFSLNYSATHAEHHNEVYALDALDAYNMRLVKRIEVKGFEVRGMRGTDGYLCLQEIKVSKAAPVARIEFKKLMANGTVKKVVGSFNEGDDIYVASGELEAYRNDFVVSEIRADQDGVLGYVRFRNGEELRCGEVVGDSAGEDIRRVQIRETIKSHLQKEEKLFSRGIKCLSLFFIDEVAKYRLYDENGEELLGEYGKIFEEEYDAAVGERLRNPCLGDDSPCSYVAYLSRFRPNMVHKGYFSIDKKGRAVDKISGSGAVAKLSRRDLEEGVNDESAYDLILKNKERLLSFEEPTRFIFSHSALREGWDNPNVFQICTLKESGSETSKRQEVGRGMRLCVNQDGDRQDVSVLGEDMVQKVNLLTVVASESYSSFVNDLQKDIRAELRRRPKRVDAALFQGASVSNGAGATLTLSNADADEIMYALAANRLIDKTGAPTQKFRDEGMSSISADDVSEHLYDFLPEIEKLVQSVYDPSALDDMVGNGLETKVLSNPLNENFGKKEFQELWNKINFKQAYTVHFDDDELRRKAVDNINRNLMVSKVTYRVVTGEQAERGTSEQLDAKSHFEVSHTETRSLSEASPIHVKYDLVGEVAKRAKITRRSAAKILAEMSSIKFALFKENPEEFIAKVGDAIVDEKATMIVAHISYSRLDERYDAAIFTETMPESMARAYRSKKNVQDYVFPDGTAVKSVERRFAEDLDAADDVVVYAKLPRSFQIPTPVGNYAPDWAIAFKQGSVKHVFFVAETKGSMNTMDLRPIEQAKIACAKKLFASMGDASVEYDVVDSYEKLLELVRG
ncbi:type III restriction-modification system endonuclease [Collinsella intestinalis]|uniref:type III restriction-modification system endonuclease n=1 Tax=Collinsella intestinalis TaxID=147207 RepID=UPI00195D6F6B|nr:DEAD/DEAH box helicase family protein [Collinsella intestinalis]MBM6942446.1 DEAD/DEAH box helicase family protein [Collinsella intestinalis]